MTAIKPKPRQWRPTLVRPINVPLSQVPCAACSGRGVMDKEQVGNTLEGTACAFCRGTGRRC